MQDVQESRLVSRYRKFHECVTRVDAYKLRTKVSSQRTFIIGLKFRIFFTNSGVGRWRTLDTIFSRIQDTNTVDFRDRPKETGDPSRLRDTIFTAKSRERDYSLILSANGATRNTITILAAPIGSRASSPTSELPPTMRRVFRTRIPRIAFHCIAFDSSIGEPTASFLSTERMKTRAY